MITPFSVKPIINYFCVSKSDVTKLILSLR